MKYLVVFLAFVIAYACCQCNKRICSDKGPCPAGYHYAPTIDFGGCPACNACIANSSASKPKPAEECGGEPLCPMAVCPQGSTTVTNVAQLNGCKSCPVCLEAGVVTDISKCKPPICAARYCKHTAPTVDRNGCPGCPKCLDNSIRIGAQSDLESIVELLQDSEDSDCSDCHEGCKYLFAPKLVRLCKSKCEQKYCQN
jgi:hypothetical protein